jgi:hypothetical protein
LIFVFHWCRHGLFKPELQQRFAGNRELLASSGSGYGCSAGSSRERTNPSASTASGQSTDQSAQVLPMEGELSKQVDD